MGVICDIIINESASNKWFRSGEQVTGVLKYHFYAPKKIEGIVISLKGEGRLSWSKWKFSTKGSLLSSSEEYVSVNDFIQETEKIVQPGYYKYSFRFDIPYHIPSSFKNEYCEISYKIVAHFSKAVFGFMDDSSTFTKEINVYGSLEPYYSPPIIFGLTKIPFYIQPKSKKLFHLKVLLEKSFFKPGEDIDVKISVLNDTDIPLKKITAKLVRHTVYRIINTKQKKTQKKTLNECIAEATPIEKSAEGIEKYQVIKETDSETVISESKENNYTIEEQSNNDTRSITTNLINTANVNGITKNNNENSHIETVVAVQISGNENSHMLKNNKETEESRVISKNKTTNMENNEIEYVCVVPTKPELCSIQHSDILEKKYMLTVEAKFKSPYKKASAQIPVAIGELMRIGTKQEKQNARKSTSWNFKLRIHL